jgi:hypothetical protein
MAPPTTPQFGPQRIDQGPLASPEPLYPKTRQTITSSTPDHHLSTSVPPNWTLEQASKMLSTRLTNDQPTFNRVFEC